MNPLGWALNTVVLLLGAVSTQAVGRVDEVTRLRIQQARGQALYEGRVRQEGQPVGAAVLRGHTQALPQVAARCVNCHEPAREPDTGRWIRFGPPLDRESLALPLRRRGGPPSSYDASTLCLTLRTGVDPAQIVLQQAMPRFGFSDDDCQALWRYLSTRRRKP